MAAEKAVAEKRKLANQTKAKRDELTNMPQSDAPVQSQPSKRFLISQMIALGIALAVVIPVEVERLTESHSTSRLAAWFVDVNVDTTPYCLLLVLAPLCWWCRRSLFERSRRWRPAFGKWLSAASKPAAGERGWAGWRAWTWAVLAGATSVAVSAATAAMVVDGASPARFGDLPPAYHDEYSYLFQAKTFLAGRLQFPSHPTAARLFDQMHVLNEGRMASRYFPATGAWIAPFLAMEHPYWGHWLAGALTAMFIFWSGRELGGNGVGLLAGLLTALSPGMGLFSNLLLSHHPTLVGLTLFLFSFLRMQRTKHWGYAVLAGAGLSFAMLARPMTAAGVGLPFGIWLFWWLAREDSTARANSFHHRLKLTAAIGLPVLLGLVVLFGYNRAITGSGWTTPYQVYTKVYTPRHVYGFNNVVRGEQRLGPKVIEPYDRWAENLTPKLAVRNVGHRLLASWQWTLGIVPMVMAAIVFAFHVSAMDSRWWSIGAAIASLHAAHVPYWYVGIMHWHYVFESGPLWLLLFAGGTQVLFEGWRTLQRPWMPIWWTGVIVASLLTTYVGCDPFWPVSRMRVAVDNIAFSRKQYAEFRTMVDRQIGKQRALVLISSDDPHIDFVINDPGLRADILYGRVRPQEMQDRARREEILRQFPDRACYYFPVKQRRLTFIAAARIDR